jgi:hypothetical protein
LTVAETVRKRGIVEVVHFTPSRGVLGTLAARAVLSRARIHDEAILEYIARVNANRILDPGYENTVHLSITAINSSFFDVSARWHPDDDWAVLAFDPVILQDNGVIFCTTNNAYPACSRGRGREGLEALFSPRVLGRYGAPHTRAAGMAANLTTDEQAEVLYPERLSTEFLRAIYVREEDFADQVHAHLGAVNHADVQVVIAPDRFELRGARGP